MTNKTLYFQNCLGVFQGGGCKGSAYVGAFKEATKWGVSFSEVVGTSAGSIVAVLIAAGATPSQLEAIISDLDFKRFLRPPVKIEQYQQPKYSNLLQYVPFELTRKYHSIFTHLGLYNSEELKVWLENNLKTLLPKAKSPIRFEDLIIPAKVVATNLTTKSVEIFSFEKTPRKEVSEAVRNSCNIPFFFQPIDMCYVDGGLLSNLPSFVFEDHAYKLYNRILAFSLESEQTTEVLNSFSTFSKALLNTTLEGNLELQLALQDDLHIININTGKIAATDFEKIDSESIKYLIKQGEIATNNFFKNETLKVNVKVKRMDISTHKSYTYNFLTATLIHKYEEILIADKDTEWVYELFPTILEWVKSGASISLLLQEASDKKTHTHFRQRILKFLGVNIITTNDLPFRGFIFDGNSNERCKAIIVNMNQEDDVSIHSKMYSGDIDFYAIASLRQKLSDIIGEVKSPETKVHLAEAEHIELLTHLKKIKQYDKVEVQMSIKKVKVSEVVFITKFVLGYKYRQIHSMFNLFKSYGLEPFSPAKITAESSAKYTLVTPPILEQHGDRLFVVEGNTRFTYAHKHNIEFLTCVVIENVNEPLSSKDEFCAKEMLLADKPMSGVDRYKNFDYAAFRSIENAVRNPNSCLL